MNRLRVPVAGNTSAVTVEPTDEAPARALASAAPPSLPPVPVAPAPAAPTTVTPTPTPPQPAGLAGPGDVPSPLAGRVTAIVVAAGQGVKEGGHLLTLEAMKMD